MSPDTLELLNRKVERLRQEHVGRLLSADTAALGTIDLARKATISACFEQVLRQTSEALSDYTKRVNAEVLAVIEETNAIVALSDKEPILQIVLQHFDENLYLERFRLFGESISRTFGRAGMTIDLAPYRPDLVNAKLHTGAANSISQSVSSLADELEVVIQRQRNAVVSSPTASESKLEKANRLVKLEPNFFGVGLNLNYLIRRLLGRRE